MPIRVLDELPAVGLLRNENIFVMTKSKVNIKSNNDRLVRILFLNLMPKKIEAENQFFRILSSFPLPVDIQLLRIDDHLSKNTPGEHIEAFYCRFVDICHERFDGLIVTGAPLGLIDFSDVFFWTKIQEVILWALKNVTSSLFVCWAVQAALNILYDVPKMVRRKKLFGIYKHHTLNFYASLTKGFDATFYVPHSRYSDFSSDMVRQFTDLEILAESDEAGAYLFTSQDKRLVFVTGHPEYDLLTLSQEYHRDLNNGLHPFIPVNYFPENNPCLMPVMTWRSHGYLLFFNWLNYYVYQSILYDI